MAEKTGLNMSFESTKIKNVLLNFLVPIVSVTVSALLFFFIVYPSIVDMPMIKAELETQTALRDLLRAKRDNINKLVDFKSVVDENSLLVDRALPSEERVPALLDQVDSIASSSGLEVTKLSYTFGEIPAEERSSSYNVVLVSLGAEGSYGQMVTFMKTAEEAARLINVANFRFASVGKEDGKLSLNFALYAPYLMVQSTAVTDDPVTLDITSTQFVDFINRVKSLKYYDYSENTNIDDLPVVPFEPEEDETTEESTSSEGSVLPETPTP
ncbi:hypothetical protein A2415_01985 [candidate division WWE3 bacterium RIFOXYC1_FULL_39_7]|uniref:Type IV pilus assembly protein PilO n=2 Tax=Katanobacteria TaxID=422282 RepID=A0A1F4X8Y5_UNCKA|nr:MAG: hypothetical protein A2415_01985 [candidate division WWE3 bacterium RIFOXYC1_FULL_39_7]OGC78128.1 MAG: hypothetical protein A2619_05250 [candidate division WWE3 bacterium RIFOXYD1_FULL_39_9]